MAHRVGDVLRIACPFTSTVVTGVNEEYVCVRWPWWEIDPDAEGSRWNGEAALGRADSSELYVTDPPALRLAPGDTCRVGIPARIVHVIEVHQYDPPQETGWLPRPSLSLIILRAGEAPDAASEFQGTGIEPGGGVPFTLELVFRPYAFVEAGDDVADADGRAWRFDDPWSWAAYDGAGGVPAWPLTLLTGRADPVAVAAATATGSHQVEVARWRRAAGLPDEAQPR
ncbi:hypothetical protein [Micromonospora sp. WMMD812]|uniref:hypothetical protein n=1 Tax=Micromonospora sp. WMMD812 TaxID=3015152 RepID=UPI00248B76D1|nr:hypothetical protein [Micromonospora sp. WMMD812]WBB68284.1 hypothetical protein O7603_02580 [Micromonospora sp. WMMD812]